MRQLHPFSINAPPRIDPSGEIPDSDDDPAWRAYGVPKIERTAAWLDGSAKDLLLAAQSWTPGFNVGFAEIRGKLASAPILGVIANTERIAGFVSVSELYRLHRTRLSVRYVHGTIAHRSLGGSKKFTRLMDTVGPRADVELLHTQNPLMAEAERRRSADSFPDPDHSRRLTNEISADLRELLRRELKRDPNFDPISGVSLAMYGHCLYSDWPLPGQDKYRSFLTLDPASAVLVCGFAECTIVNKALVTALQEAA